jgi:hypothetical protein
MGGALVGAGSHNPQICVLPDLHATWSSSTLVILFSEMLKFSTKQIFFRNIFLLKENKESDGII